MKREVCRPLVSLFERGELQFPWFDSRYLARQALEYIMQLAHTLELEVLSPKVICSFAYIV